MDNEDGVAAYNRISRSPAFILERYILLNEIKRLQPQGKLVDIGCGPGYLAAKIARRYPGLSVTGLDVSDLMIELARRKWQGLSYGNLEFITGDAQCLPYSDDSVDIAVSSLALHHWEDGAAALADIHRVLKPNGRLVLFDVRRDASYAFYYGLNLVQAFSPEALRRTNGAVGSFWASYNAGEIINMLSQCDWQDVEISRGVGWFMVRGLK
jgi:ubiquinone/menaquinone biosynthesis C-methylase UbiE